MTAMIHRHARHLARGGIVFALCVVAPGWPAQAFADHLAHALLFDSRESAEDQGLVRLLLGNLEASGRPATESLESADRTRKAFDMRTAGAVSNAFIELGATDAIWTMVTHGGLGLIQLEGRRVKGFGLVGSGRAGNCGDPAVRLPDVVRRGVTVSMVVCYAARESTGVRSVATTLDEEIAARGGSVRQMKASAEAGYTQRMTNWEVAPRDPPTRLTREQADRLTAALGERLQSGMLGEFAELQARLDAIVAPDAQGSRVTACIKYRGVIPGVETLGGDFSRSCNGRPFGAAADEDEYELGPGAIRTPATGCDDCNDPTAVDPVTWGSLKQVYR